FMKHEMEGPIWLNYLSFGLAIAILAIGCSVVLILLWPAARGALELGALTYLLVELARFATPIMPSWMIEGSAQFFWWPVLYFSLALLRDSTILERVSPKLPLRLRDQRKVKTTPEAIWAAVAPDADNLGTYWNNALTRIDPLSEAGDNMVEARFNMGRFGALIQYHNRRIWDKPLHFLYDFKPENGIGFTVSYEMVCEPLDDGWCRVTSTQTYRGVSVGKWTFLWLDDMVRDEMDGIVATMKGRRDWSLGGWAARKLARA
ncbi:MAG: SRPBCC family protein, partial [Pseudomonadota bacterium]